jgi:hypothetical protein
MESSAQPVPGYYVWQAPGKPVVVHVHLDVIDRIAAEVMRGFGAVPKRGAEVGGVLLGSVEPGEPSIVRIEDYEAVPCGYKRGPSYLLTADDKAAFDETCERWMPDATRDAYAVGYFRSHTRDGLALSAEDVVLMDEHFAAPEHLALLIKPFATKPSIAGFFAREDGLFPDATPLEFPFRRREITGEEAPPRRSLMERQPRVRESREPEPREVHTPPRNRYVPEPEPVYATATTMKSRARSGWVWIPLSVVFLLLGVLVGFQAALSFGSGTRAANADFSLGLTVSRNEENLSVKWDRQAAAVKTAQKGLLEIEDGSYTKPVDLDPAQLQNGSIVYKNASPTVRFRLTVFPKARVSVTETMEWTQ